MLPWASALLAVLGLALIICGLVMWYRRQRVRDRAEEAATTKAEYEVQRRHMMQEWSDILDAWIAGKPRAPVLVPPAAPLLIPDPALARAG